MSEKRSVMLGGTFNPPHNGHVAVIKNLLNQLDIDRVIAVPAHKPAHKTVGQEVSPQQRLEMAELAFQSISGCIVDDCEIRRKGFSYTIDTVIELKRRYGIVGKLGIVVGFDLLEGLPLWKNWAELQKLVYFVIARRGRESVKQIPLQKHQYKILDNPLYPISSQEIRSWLYNDYQDSRVKEEVPHSVYSYIVKNHLYQKPQREKILEKRIYPDRDSVEYLVKQEISNDRFRHTQSTAEMCVELGKRFGADEESCWLAGMWHDIAREWPQADLIEFIQDHEIDVYPVEKKNPALFHAPAAAERLISELNVTNEDIWKAVRWHTTGHPDMGKLGYILFIADFAEPMRSHLDNEIRKKILEKSSLDEMMYEIYTLQKKHFEENQIPFSSPGLDLYKELEHILSKK